MSAQTDAAHAATLIVADLVGRAIVGIQNRDTEIAALKAQVAARAADDAAAQAVADQLSTVADQLHTVVPAAAPVAAA